MFAISAGLTVGVDAIPHDASERIMSEETSDRIFFFIFSPLRNIFTTK